MRCEEAFNLGIARREGSVSANELWGVRCASNPLASTFVRVQPVNSLRLGQKHIELEERDEVSGASRLNVGDQLFGEVSTGWPNSAGLIPGLLTKQEDRKVYITLFVPKAIFNAPACERGFGGFGVERSESQNAIEHFIFRTGRASFALYGCVEMSRTSSSSMSMACLVYRAEHVVGGIGKIPLKGGCGSVKFEISGLFAWLNQASIVTTMPVPGSNQSPGVKYATIHNPPVEIASARGYSRSLRSDWSNSIEGRRSARGVRVGIQSLGILQRDCEVPTRWRDCFDDAIVLRDLLSISSWQPQEVLDILVTFELLSGPGEDEGDRPWHPVEGLDWVVPAEEVSPAESHLFHFEDIGTPGIEKWFELYHHRATSRVVQSLDLFLRVRMPLARRIQLLGGAIDGLHVYLWPPQKENDKSPGSETQCRDLLAYLGLENNLKDGWPERMSLAYNASKHADNKKHPGYVGEETEDLRAFHEGVYVARLVLAKILGVTGERLATLARQDPCNPEGSEYFKTVDPFDAFGPSHSALT